VSEPRRGTARLRRRRTPRAAAPARRGSDPIVDALASLVLAVLAVVGLHHVYTGWAYLVLGLLGAGLATAVVLGLRALGRGDPLLVTIVLVLAFPLGAGIVMATGPVPTGEALGLLAGGVQDAWKNLLNTAPPVGVGGGFGVVPYTMGFVVAGAGLVLARHTDSPLIPAVPALVALVLGFLLGTAEVVSVLVQGAAVLVVVLAWGAVRGNRSRRIAGPPHWGRLASGAAMLAAVAVLGLAIGPNVPLAQRDSRFNLRHEPPFNARRDPSPLVAYRNYVVGPAREDALLTVTGLPPGARLRVASLDTYDGQSWRVGGDDAPASGRFEKVGEAILPVPPGDPAMVTVRVERDRPDMWVPTVGATRSVRFDGGRARQLTAEFRYNRATRSAVAPDRLRAGDRFTLDARLPPPVDEDLARTRATVGIDRLAPLPPLPDSLTRRATALTLDATSDYDRALALARALREGTSTMPTYYSDGGTGTEATASASASGHSLARLVRFVDARNGLVGNAEQYAATMALMARRLGLPALVVLGFRPPADAARDADGALTVRSVDVDAWVEIAFEGLGWLSFDPTPPRDRRPDESPTVNQREVDLSQQQPPPPTYLQVPESLPELVVRPPEPPLPPTSPLEAAGGLLRAVLLVSAPVWLAVLVVAVIVAAKLQRSRRRRRRGPPVQRLAGAWWEVCDRARDLGASIPLRATRLEIARAIAPIYPGAPPLAVRIDEAMFAAPLPTEPEVSAIWDKLDAEHHKVIHRLSAGQRLRVALNLASLRPRRWFH
jgi:transglutaminase-like putative cysteine protease